MDLFLNRATHCIGVGVGEVIALAQGVSGSVVLEHPVIRTEGCGVIFLLEAFFFRVVIHGVS